MDSHEKNLALRRKLDLEKETKYKNDSKERLKKICITKIKTTMIGALEAVEKKLEQYLTTEGRPNNEQLLLRKIYEEMRNDILDKGNQQIRNLEAEFEQYEIEWKRYTLQLPVVKGGLYNA